MPSTDRRDVARPRVRSAGTPDPSRRATQRTIALKLVQALTGRRRRVAFPSRKSLLRADDLRNRVETGTEVAVTSGRQAALSVAIVAGLMACSTSPYAAPVSNLAKATTELIAARTAMMAGERDDHARLLEVQAELYAPKFKASFACTAPDGSGCLLSPVLPLEKVGRTLPGPRVRPSHEKPKKVAVPRA